MSLVHSVQLPIGEWEAPDFTLHGTDNREYSLADFKDAKGFVVVFTCNHCPYAQASWPILIDLANQYKERRIKFVAINPNDAGMYPEDSFEEMKGKVSELKIPFPYLYDETQETAKAYQARCTPDIYLFNDNMKLYYHGRINDNWQDTKKVQEENLKDAIESLLRNDPPPPNQHSSMGCSIKWKV